MGFYLSTSYLRDFCNLTGYIFLCIWILLLLSCWSIIDFAFYLFLVCLASFHLEHARKVEHSTEIQTATLLEMGTGLLRNSSGNLTWGTHGPVSTIHEDISYKINYWKLHTAHEKLSSTFSLPKQAFTFFSLDVIKQIV